MPRFFAAASLIFLLFSPVSPALASKSENSSVRLNTPSGYPVPRFVSLKTGKTHCRSGPSFEHPVKLTYMRRGLPVIVIAETTDHWRKIKDLEGDECWVHSATLSGAETALVTAERLPVRKKPFANAPAEALLGRGVIARIEGARGDWLKISTQGVKGWTLRTGLWGAAATTDYVAPHN